MKFNCASAKITRVETNKGTRNRSSNNKKNRRRTQPTKRTCGHSHTTNVPNQQIQVADGATWKTNWNRTAAVAHKNIKVDKQTIWRQLMRFTLPFGVAATCRKFHSFAFVISTTSQHHGRFESIFEFMEMQNSDANPAIIYDNFSVHPVLFAAATVFWHPMRRRSTG